MPKRWKEVRRQALQQVQDVNKPEAALRQAGKTNYHNLLQTANSVIIRYMTTGRDSFHQRLWGEILHL